MHWIDGGAGASITIQSLRKVSELRTRGEKEMAEKGASGVQGGEFLGEGVTSCGGVQWG